MSLRQHPPQRRGGRERRRRSRRGSGPGLRRLGPRQRRLSERHGRPHRAGDRRPRARDRARRVRHRGRLAGLLRGLHPVGASRTISRPAARPSRRSASQFVADVTPFEHDEDPHPQRRPCDHRLSVRADGHPFRPRGHGGPAGPRLPAARSSARRSSRSCRRCRTPISKDYFAADRAPLLPTRRSATPSAGSASTARTGSRSSSSRRSPTGSNAG